MNICVIGAGMQGSVAALDLTNAGHKVTVLDNNLQNLRFLKKIANVKPIQFNVMNKVKFIKSLKKFDAVVGALPSAMGLYTMECVILAGVDLVDMSYSPGDPFLLDKKARAAKIRIVPDAGFAPGLSNVLIGEVYKDFDGFDELRILVGGIPQNPQPPFNYYITWSPVDLIEEYTRPARIMKKSEIITIDALSGIEEFNLPRIGCLECFYTDGLRTLLKTLKKVNNMEEKTIRYPGHAQLFKMIIQAGFLAHQMVAYKTRSIDLREISIEYLKHALRKGDKKDISIMIIEMKRNSRKKRLVCIDYYDPKKGISSMARMTAYTASIITQGIKDYPNYGVIPPEYLGMDEKFCGFIKTELARRNIRIETT